MITHPAFTRRAVGGERGAAQARRARPGRVGLRALQRPHRPAREPRRGRAVRPPRHLPQRLLRDPPAAVRGGRLRLPGGRPDRRQRHQRQAHPAARRRRAVRHPLRRAARATRARSTCATGVLRRHVRWRSPSGREIEVNSHPAGLVRAALRRRDPLRGQRRSTTSRCGSSPSPSSSPTSRAPSGPRDPRAAAALEAPLEAEEQEVNDLRVVLVHRTRKQQAADGGGHGPRRREGRRDRRRRRGRRRPRPRVADRRAAARRAACASPSSSPTAGRAGARCPSVRDQVDAAVPRAKRTGWESSRTQQREYLDDFWEHADVEIDGDGELQQAVRFALFHTLQAGARAERRAIPAKGLTGPGYDGHAFWDTETFVLPLLTYTQPTRRRRRAALAPRHARPRARARQDAGAQGRRVPVADDPRPGVQRATGPPGTAGVPRQRRHRGRRHPLRPGHRRRGVRGRHRPGAARPHRAAVALARPSRPRGRASTSTASPAPTSTPRSPTTTSTRT